ncbi:hypothetical protein HaLaN_16613 [Haematococcus lacustris]|uniref:Uncharacterized protein n=1 Tax=Haematococcus lacustris TaxID=44745 RepID=A0A699ZJB9_HAELA|nr:hypothetical protein HaLaN_16613 [Haematococcus lacustris]
MSGLATSRLTCCFSASAATRLEAWPQCCTHCPVPPLRGLGAGESAACRADDPRHPEEMNSTGVS